MTKKETTKAVMAVASADQLAIINAAYPVNEDGYQEVRLPRLGMLAKDLTEETGSGRNKKIEVVQPAGTFYTETETDETEDIFDDNNKKIGTRKVWETTYFEDEEIDAIIFFNRKQLKFYDEPNNSYVSSPIYDSSEEKVPLFQNKKEIAKDFPKNLQAMYPSVTANGKASSKLKETKILYVLFKGEVYQVNLSESSKYSFLNYGKRNQVQTLVTTIGSLEQTKGSNTYRQMTFEPARTINAEEANLVIKAVTDMKDYLAAKQQHFAQSVDEGAEDGDNSNNFKDFSNHIAGEQPTDAKFKKFGRK